MATWHGFYREARRFWDVAQAVNGQGYTNQAVSNAIHAVIAANDAVCLFFINERPRGPSHPEASRLLTKACKGTKWEEEAAQRVRQLADILQAKTASQYEGKPMGGDRAKRIMGQAERFIGWVREVLPHAELADSEPDSPGTRPEGESPP
ncbi:MAG: HEPN domain-containing protein [Armatimonadetes bacterium]|nr:HEPN domain-containing protein [Armatimonadota bacterium]